MADMGLTGREAVPGDIARLQAERDALAQIVADLAAAEPQAAREFDGSLYCALCGADMDSPTDRHEPDCPWLRAADWLRHG